MKLFSLAMGFMTCKMVVELGFLCSFKMYLASLCFLSLQSGYCRAHAGCLLYGMVEGSSEWLDSPFMGYLTHFAVTLNWSIVLITLEDGSSFSMMSGLCTAGCSSVASLLN